MRMSPYEKLDRSGVVYRVHSSAGTADYLVQDRIQASDLRARLLKDETHLGQRIFISPLPLWTYEPTPELLIDHG